MPPHPPARPSQPRIETVNQSRKGKHINEQQPPIDPALGTNTDLKVLGNFTNETLEGQFANEKFGGLLVSANLSEGDSSGPETMGLLDTSSGGRLVRWARVNKIPGITVAN